jgi:hypothetical protein
MLEDLSYTTLAMVYLLKHPKPYYDEGCLNLRAIFIDKIRLRHHRIPAILKHAPFREPVENSTDQKRVLEMFSRFIIVSCLPQLHIRSAAALLSPIHKQTIQFSSSFLT